MNLSDYLKTLTPDQVASFADKAGTSVGYLTTQLAYGYRRIGPQLALALEAASEGALKADELCPDFPWSAAANPARCRCAQ